MVNEIGLTTVTLRMLIIHALIIFRNCLRKIVFYPVIVIDTKITQKMLLYLWCVSIVGEYFTISTKIKKLKMDLHYFCIFLLLKMHDFRYGTSYKGKLT